MPAEQTINLLDFSTPGFATVQEQTLELTAQEN
jgi:hypothetical protein